MYLPLLYCIKEVVCRLYEMLYPCICNVVISCWKSGEYVSVICRGGTDMCFVPGSGWKHLDLEQYRILGLKVGEPPADAMHIVLLGCVKSCLLPGQVMHDGSRGGGISSLLLINQRWCESGGRHAVCDVFFFR